MLITEIKDGRGNKLHIYLDGEYALTVTDKIASEYALKKGMALEEDMLRKLTEEYLFTKAKNRALRLLSIRDHSSYELRQKLLRDFPEDAAAYAVEEMTEFGYLDDLRFAKHFAELLQKNKKMSLRGIEQELRRRGVDSGTIRDALSEMEEDPQQQIAAILHKKYPTALADEKSQRRAVNALMRLGYHCSDIFDVLKCMETEFDDEE